MDSQGRAHEQPRVRLTLAGGDEATGGAGNADSTGKGAWSLKEIGEALAAFTGAVGLLTLLAVIIFCAQLWWAYRLDFDTIWYAAMLLPPKNLLGQGLRVLWFNPLMILAIPWLLYTVTRPIPPAYLAELTALPDNEVPPSSFWQTLRPMKRREKLSLSVMLAVALLALLFPLGYGFQGDWLRALGEFLRTALLLLCGLGAGLVLLFIMLRAALRGHSTLRKIALSLLVFYALGAVTVLVEGHLSRPPLPPITINVDNGPQISGRLLTQSGDYWYVLVEPRGPIRPVPKDKSGIPTIGK
jgi:hypothetical protein